VRQLVWDAEAEKARAHSNQVRDTEAEKARAYTNLNVLFMVAHPTFWEQKGSVVKTNRLSQRRSL